MQTPVVANRNIDPDTIGKIAFVVARFNLEISQGLLDGAVQALHEMGFSEKQWDVLWVPGAFEVPLVAQKVASHAKYSGVVTLGSVIRGDTPHFDYVCSSAAHGVLQASLNSGVPITFGILTCDNRAQALTRASADPYNKGREAVVALLDVLQTLSEI